MTQNVKRDVFSPFPPSLSPSPFSLPVPLYACGQKSLLPSAGVKQIRQTSGIEGGDIQPTHSRAHGVEGDSPVKRPKRRGADGFGEVDGEARVVPRTQSRGVLG